MFAHHRPSFVLCLLCAASSTTVVAENRYAGLQYLETTYTEIGFQDNKPTAMVMRLGQLNNNFGIEGRLGSGLSDHFYSAPPFDYGIEINNLAGIYGLANFPASKHLDFYGLIGLSRLQFTKTNINSGTPYSITEDEEYSYSYGFGSNVKLGDTVAINLEYTLYLNEDYFDVTAASLGVTINFN